MTTYAPYPVVFREKLQHSSFAALLPLVAFALLHAPLAIAIRQSEAVATVHALVTLLVCVSVALFSTRAVHILAAMGYIAGAEVLWRMSGASVFWEFGKYSICLVLIVTIVRLKDLRLPKLALLYFALLLPACLMTLFGFGPVRALGPISFDLSAPLTVLLMLCFLRNVQLGSMDLSAALGGVLAPTIGIAAVVLSRSYGADIRFTGASNNALSGGFGPNQVASALALGALAAVWIIFTARLTGIRRFAFIALALGLFVQSAMTFSRSGVYLTGISLLIAVLMLASDRRYRRTILGAMLVLVLGCAILFPLLNAYTDGHLLARFQRKDITNRDILMSQDFELWRANPFFGAGVGYSALVHFNGTAAHTEYTRLIAEHGVLGLGALLMLLFTAFGRWGRCRDRLEKAFVASMFAWFFLYIGVNGMRMAAPVFALGLGYAQWKLTPVRAAIRAATVRER